MRVLFFCQRCTERALYKTLRRKINQRGSVSHPNVLPVIEVSETLFPLCTMSPWMPDGNITQYIQMNPSANRLMLVLAHQPQDRLDPTDCVDDSWRKCAKASCTFTG